MAYKQTELFEKDYDTLLLRAGGSDKIKYVVRALIALSNQAATDLRKWDAWRKAVEDTNPGCKSLQNVDNSA